MQEPLTERSIWIQRFIIFVSSVLILQTGWLQLIDPTYGQKAERTTLVRRTLYPGRGLIMDRTGHVMVHNIPVYDLKVIYNQVPKTMDTLLLCKLLEILPAEYRTRIEKDWKSLRFSKSIPFTFMEHIPADKFQYVQEYLHLFPGFYGELRSARGYFENHSAHILGYMSEVDQNKVDQSKGLYVGGDYTGSTGVENFYETQLRGIKGSSYILKDNLGREIEALDEGRHDSLAVSGDNLILSLDHMLQSYGQELLKNKRGSIVAIEPSTGEILAMVSSPGYDPNELSISRSRGDAFLKLQEDTLNPLFDRSVMAMYPPGSIFKPILALIAMQDKIINENKTVYCNGAYYSGGLRRGCHNHPTAHNVAEAVQYSCNTYFFTVYKEVIDQAGYTLPEIGMRKLNAHLAEFGLGRKISADVASEKKGNLPGPSYFDQIYGPGKWRSSYILSMGIGQGELQLTTLQMAHAAAIIANEGTYTNPHILKARVPPGGQPVSEYYPRKRVHIDYRYFGPVIEGMSGAVRAGTATQASHPTIEMCGKTGTSENPHGEDHSVFFGFAPRNQPKIAIAVYIENAGWGGSFATPVAGLMMEKYLTGEIIESRKPIETRMLEADLIHKPKS
ncbi:MAG: penicillin-binding transpeptidase domain-containing protein [Bacteroidota bacterium]|nr:penicillin-binding transpeptidase domain-containing protein [Bacteroidota bacterium]